MTNAVMKISDDIDVSTMPNARAYTKRGATVAVKMVRPFSVTTQYGVVMQGDVGDYLCQGPVGPKDKYPCKASVFENTYRDSAILYDGNVG